MDEALTTKDISCPLSKDNFDLDNITYRSETTIEHDDSEYDHWEVTMFLPKFLTSEQIPVIVQKILDSQQAIEILGRIEIYVRLLQDGDPENEKPKEILDNIEKEIVPMLKAIYNE